MTRIGINIQRESRPQRFRPNLFGAPQPTAPGALPSRLLPAVRPTVKGPTFELAFGFIPTVNVGNALGIDNDAARIILNILADPITIGLSFFTGGLTAAGKVASATKAIQTTKGVLRVQKGVTGLERVNSTRGLIKNLAKIESNPDIARAMKAAIDSQDALGFTKALRKLNKSSIDPELRKLLPNTAELFQLDDLLQAEKLFNAGQAGTGLTKELVPGFVNQVEKGQRALIQGRVPFTNIRKSLVEGKFVYQMLDSVFPASPLLGKKLKAMSQGKGVVGAEGVILATTFRELFKGMLQNRGNLINKEVIPAAKQVVDGLTAKMERIAKGSSTQGLPEILTFFREGAGIDKATVEALGLGDEFARLGIKSTTKTGAAGKTFELFEKAELNKFLDRRGNWRKAADELNTDLERHFEELRQYMNASGLGLDIPHIESYINRIWDIDAKTAGKIAKDWQRSATFLNKRKFKTAIAGLSEGFKLKEINSFKLLNEYQITSARIVQNRQIMETIKNPLNKLRFNNIEVPVLATRKMLEKLNKSDPTLDLLNDYKEITDKSVLNFLKISGARTGRNMVPKSLEKDLGAIFGRPFDGPIARMADNFNSNSKFLQLASSFFHGVALTESSMATLGPLKGARVSLSLGAGIPFLPKSLREAMMKTGLGKDATALADDAINSARAAGLQLGSIDNQMQFVQKALGGIDQAIKKRIPGSAKILDTVGPGKIIDNFNTALWQNFHEPLKLIAFQDRLKKARKLNPDVDPSQLAADVASFVNDAFGGQNWETLLVSRKMKQVMNWALLAPDWTISNLRIAGVGSTGISGAVRGVLGKGRNPKEQLVGSYWRHAVPIFYGMTALLNRASSGHWLWENAPGHELDIELADRDDKGKIQYIKLGKQFREPFRWLTEPFKIFGAKLSPGIQTAVEQFTAHSTTGFPTEFAAEKQPIPLTVMETVPLRAKTFVSKFIPFSFRGNNFMMALPKSTFSQRDAVRGVADSMKGTKLRKGPDAEAVKAILQLAEANGLDVARIKSIVRREVGDPTGLLQKE